MYPYFYIGEFKIAAYSVMAIIGGLAVGLFAYIRLRKRDVNWARVLNFLIYAFGFLVIGAMLLYQIVNLPNVIKNPDNFGFGLVFYGGLYGALIGIGVFAHINTEDSRDLLMLLTPAIPLFHIFGRIGCFMSGCCYGYETEDFGILHPDGNYYFPVQLIEAFGELVIFIVLCILPVKSEKYYRPLGVYLVTYGIMRFVLELFRGDEVRGFLGLLSTSQWISIVTVPLGLYCLLAPTSKNFLNRLYLSSKITK